MTNTIEVLDGEYVVRPVHASTGALIAEVSHLHRRGARKLFIRVAHLSAFAHPGADMTYPHWCIRLFVPSDVRYEEYAKRTVIVSNLQRRAGFFLFKRLIQFFYSEFPSIHPELPRALGRALVAASYCSEPMVVHVHSSMEQSSLEIGEVYHDDD